jgi:hypothetical protein
MGERRSGLLIDGSHSAHSSALYCPVVLVCLLKHPFSTSSTRDSRFSPPQLTIESTRNTTMAVISEEQPEAVVLTNDQNNGDATNGEGVTKPEKPRARLGETEVVQMHNSDSEDEGQEVVVGENGEEEAFNDPDFLQGYPDDTTASQTICHSSITLAYLHWSYRSYTCNTCGYAPRTCWICISLDSENTWKGYASVRTTLLRHYQQRLLRVWKYWRNWTCTTTSLVTGFMMKNCLAA